MYDHTPLTRKFGSLEPWQHCPAFYTAKIETGMPAIDRLTKAKRVQIGQSVAGQPILALEYGEFEPLQDILSDNLHSSLASNIVPPDPTDIYPPSFYGSNRRKKPSLILQGGIHGGELTGTVANINLCHVIETGADLRGKPWPRLQELALATRLVIIPWLNPDSTNRWPLYHTANAPRELLAMCTYGVKHDGEVLRYPLFKQFGVIPPQEMAFMGSYFNDNGINLQYDLMAVERQPETTAWMRYYLKERADAALVWHCNDGSLMGPCEFYLPQGHQHTHSRVSGAVYRRLSQEGLPLGRLSWAALPGMGKPFLEQSSAIYHVSGALPLMSELPLARQGLDISCDTLLDMGLIHIEEVLEFGHSEGFRPYEYQHKIKTQADKASAAKPVIQSQ